jgi:hypothetical protein
MDTERITGTTGEIVTELDITTYVRGLNFPARKQQLIERAKSNKAPQNVINFLNQLPDKTYNFLKDVQAELQAQNIPGKTQEVIDQIESYLKGINFPARKQQLVNAAKSNKAPEQVMQFLNSLPDRTYNMVKDVQAEFKKIK